MQSPHAESSPIIIAHRGNSSVAPENTIAAIHAARHCAWGAEIDVQKTADGQYVLMHDSTVDRTTNGTGRVDQLSFDYIRSLDASWKFPKYSPQQVPTLLEAVGEAMACKLKLYIDIKTGTPCDLFSILSPYSHCIELHSLYWNILKAINDLGGDFTYVAAGSGNLEAQIPNMPACINKVSWYWPDIMPTGIDAVHALNKPLYAWTVNSSQKAMELAEMGVDGILTDFPAKMLELFTADYIPGDANCDGTVDESDAMTLAENWRYGVRGTADATWKIGDFNRDGKETEADATLLAVNWGRHIDAAANVVPEPGEMVLILMLLPSYAAVAKRSRASKLPFTARS